MKSDRKIAASFPPATPSATPPANGVSNALSQVRPMSGRTSGPTRRSTRGQWTPDEDEILRQAVQLHNGKNWKKIAECFKDRTDVQCLHRWQKVLNPELIKGPWSKEEDEIIVQLVEKYGPKKWSTISQHLPGRIGKQCRERWHNHLNPAINKEAWTQEEEIILIRAHQIHGNRWAELTKYLPGRTDNSIKNHWNSSVKKKLDSYIASGLLAQFQGLPLVSHQSYQSMPTTSFRVHHTIGDDRVCKDQAEDNSECSQIGCSQTASDMSNTGCQTTEGLLLPEESGHGKVQTTSPSASCSVQYCTSLDDITFTVPHIPYDFSCPSLEFEGSFSEDPGTYAARNCNSGAIGLPHVSSFELAAEYRKDEIVHSPFHQSTSNNEQALVNNVAMGSDVHGQKQKTEEHYSRVTFSPKGDDRFPGNLTKCSEIIDMEKYREALQSSFQLNAAERDASRCRNLSYIEPEVALGNDSMISTTKLNQIDLDMREQTNPVGPSRLVPVNTFDHEASDSQQIHPSVVQKAEERKGEHEGGTLCYEPPRFPSLDIPFFSCDLAQSSTDGLQEFSPLGIRQLMMPSMNNLTPFKLWDSPSSGDSPDALLKSAAKTFACTPSILKKRHRDLLSPLSPFSERRYGKKIGSEVNKELPCPSRLNEEFSRLDVVLDEAAHCNESPSPCHDQNNPTTQDKENIYPVSEEQTRERKCCHDSGGGTLEEEWNENGIMDMDKEWNSDHDAMITVFEDHTSETPRGILVERPSSDTRFSTPDGPRPKAGLKSSEKPSGVNQAVSIVSPSFLAQKEANDFALSRQSTSTEMADGLLGEIGAENLNIFGGTPFRRSIESPSAWKSPWYFSSLAPGPRIDTDITIEDIGIFMSPGMGSIDAIGLMKQINKQNADAYADAREVLGIETPESILRQRILTAQNPERQSTNEGRLHSASNLLTEGRTLDFSECGTPEKSAEKRKHISSASLSSPSFCLLKNYR